MPLSAADSSTQYAQELLSTFSTSLGEVALAPGTGGVFTVELIHALDSESGNASAPSRAPIWDRKVDGGFPGMFLLSSWDSELSGIYCESRDIDKIRV